MSAAVLTSANGSAAKNHAANGKPRADWAEAATAPRARTRASRTRAEDLAPAKKTRKRRAWEPAARDHYIYGLVKFEGHTQSEVASMQQVSQTTVSRIVQRYERWQAHADPREGGRLDPAERLRAQRWLTYERNELILGTALRIARAVEGTAELWKTVRTEPKDPYRTDKASVRDETTMIDRTGVAARFLRLAFKVNMEQLALVEKDPPPLPEALSAEEIAEEERQDAAVAEDLTAQEPLLPGTEPGPGDVPMDAAHVAAPSPPAPLPHEERGDVLEQVCSRVSEEAAGLNLHNVHNHAGARTSASTAPAATCAPDPPPPRSSNNSCMLPQPSNNPMPTRFDKIGPDNLVFPSRRRE